MATHPQGKEGTCQRLLNKFPRPAFRSKVHWDFVLGWGGGRCRYGRNWAQARERCGPRNSRAYDRLRPPQSPLAAAPAFILPGTFPLENERVRSVLGCQGSESLGQGTLARSSTEPCSCPILLEENDKPGRPQETIELSAHPHPSPSFKSANPLRNFWAFTQ